MHAGVASFTTCRELRIFLSTRELEAYLSTIENYAAHQFTADPVLKAQIDSRLGFAFKALGYTAA